MSASPPTLLPLYFAPVDCAASSIIGTLNFFNSSISHTLPNKSTPIIALVLSVIFLSSISVAIQKSFKPISANTGVAPTCLMHSTELTHV